MAGTTEGTLVEAARAGDDEAFGQLFDQWFDRVHDLSRRIVRDPGIAGEVAQDTFLTAWTRLATLQDPDAFGGWLLRIARNGSLNRLSKERRSVALDDETMTTITDKDATDPDPLARMDQAARIDLVWDAAAALGERDMSILDLHLRHGLGAADLAEELGTTANNAHQLLFTLRKRLGTNVRALVLWRAGRPACDDLRRTLAGAGIHTFDKQAVKVIDRHAEACASCTDERSERLSPAALFAAAPVVAAPILLKAHAASALEASGVPMGGSSALVGGAGGIGGIGGIGGVGGTGTGSGSGSSTGAGAVGQIGGAIGAGGVAGPRSTVVDFGGAASGPGAPDDGHGGGDGGEGGGQGGPVADPHHGSDPDPRDRHHVRWLAIAAILALLVGSAILATQVMGDGHGPEEVATVGTTATTAFSGAPVPTTAVDAAGPTSVPGGFDIGPGDEPATTSTVLDPTAPPVVVPTSPGPGAQPPATIPPVTTRPPATVPANPTTTSTTPATTTSTAPPAPSPTIVRFGAALDTQCRGGYSWILTWYTTDSTQVGVGPTGGPVTVGAPTGKTTVCTPTQLGSPTPFTLVAYGPGGQTTRTVQGQSQAPIP